MAVEVITEPIAALEKYGRIPIAFEVRTVLDVAELGNGSGQFVLSERRIETPYLKDYDAISDEGPAQWARRFDVTDWGVLVARREGHRVGGAVVTGNSPSLSRLADRPDVAILWDIRVSPEARGQRIGSALFRAAEAWARARSCRQLKVETQNINVPACRFYVRQGCTLETVVHFAYPKFVDEIQLLWSKDLC